MCAVPEGVSPHETIAEKSLLTGHLRFFDEGAALGTALIRTPSSLLSRKEKMNIKMNAFETHSNSHIIRLCTILCI